MGRAEGLRPCGHEYSWPSIPRRHILRYHRQQSPAQHQRAGAAAPRQVKPAIEQRGGGNALTPSALALFCFSLLLPYTIEAEDADKRARDKSGYNLLLPPHPEMMRELSAHPLA